MRQLLEAPVVELDAATQAVCDEVCGALEWFDERVAGSHEPAQAMRLGRKWWIAFRNTGDHECRAKIVACCDAIVRADDEIALTTQGHIFTRDQIVQHRGQFVYERQDDGTMRRILQWPTGTYASGMPAYGPREDQAA